MKPKEVFSAIVHIEEETETPEEQLKRKERFESQADIFLQSILGKNLRQMDRIGRKINRASFFMKNIGIPRKIVIAGRLRIPLIRKYPQPFNE